MRGHDSSHGAPLTRSQLRQAKSYCTSRRAGRSESAPCSSGGHPSAGQTPRREGLIIITAIQDVARFVRAARPTKVWIAAVGTAPVKVHNGERQRGGGRRPPSGNGWREKNGEPNTQAKSLEAPKLETARLNPTLIYPGYSSTPGQHQVCGKPNKHCRPRHGSGLTVHTRVDRPQKFVQPARTE